MTTINAHMGQDRGSSRGRGVVCLPLHVVIEGGWFWEGGLWWVKIPLATSRFTRWLQLAWHSGPAACQVAAAEGD